MVLNPQAGRGTALDKVQEVDAALTRHGLRHEIVLSRKRGHATSLARDAWADGVDVIAVVGGDGTLNEVAQAFLEDGEPRTGPDLAVLPAGTGGDFGRTLGLSGAIEEAVARIRFGSRRPVDLGQVAFAGPRGEDVRRAFVNVASFGIGGRVDALVAEGPRWLGGRGSYLVATALAMTTFRNPEVRVVVDGVPWYEGRAFSVAIANGRFFGGGMMIAPHADVSDGRLDVVALGDLRRREVALLSPHLYRGAHLARPGVKVAACRRVVAEAVHPWATVLLDVDGEQPGKLPLTASVFPGALTFRA